MVAEQEEESDSPEGRRIHKNKQFWYQMKMFMERMFQQENKSRIRKPEESKRVALEEKYFRRMSKFGGEIPNLGCGFLT
eukprot:9418370-Karenia_brevis.AAC.1